MKMSEHWVNVYPEWCQRYGTRELADYMESDSDVDVDRVMLLHMVPDNGSYLVTIIEPTP
jgi:hypothetical protein